MAVASLRMPRIKAEPIAEGFDVTEDQHSDNAQTKESKLRIQFTTDERYQQFLSDTRLTRVLENDVPVASLENIVRGKLWAWRDPKRRLSKRKKDELDLIRVAEKYPGLRQMMPPEITDQLEQR